MIKDTEENDLLAVDTNNTEVILDNEASSFEEEKRAFEKFSLDENFVNAVKLTNSLINKLYNKPTVKEKVFPAVFVIDKDNIKNLYKKIDYKLELHNISDTEFSIMTLGTDLNNNKQSTEFNNFNDFYITNDTKEVQTKLVVLQWKTKLFLNNTKNPITKIIGEEFNIEITISSSPNDSSDEAYFMFNDYPIKTKGIIQVSVVHSNQVIADELIQHVSDFVSGIEDKKYKEENFISLHKQGLAQMSEKLLGVTSIIPLTYLFFNKNNCLSNPSEVIRLLTLSFFFFVITILFGNILGSKVFYLLNKRKTISCYYC